MVDTGLGQAECHGLGTEWAVLTNEVSEVESRKYLQERQAGVSGVSGVGVQAFPRASWGPTTHLHPMTGVWTSGLKEQSSPSPGPGPRERGCRGQEGGTRGGQLG